ncbi:MAG: methyltransferase domain-containing protein [Clostridiales bacterium]|nr:methyltransferase domain-containing protein [Clostridiales bacterium]
MSIEDKAVVSNQYATSSRLETRISIHEKYSRNKLPFGEWVVSHYDLQPGEQVLELGCGTGSMWQGMTLPDGCHVTLTDLSAGMLETARQNTAHLCADYAVCDAMTVPYSAAAFDVVIANMMLYHVPDIDRALSEIRRVLKPNGRFFAATFGEHGAVEAVLEMLKLPCSANHRFTLQNGTAQLEKHFSEIHLIRREDALDVTHLPDLITYLRSMQGMTVLADLPDDELLAVFSAHLKDGVLSLPKEYGLFICT